MWLRAPWALFTALLFGNLSLLAQPDAAVKVKTVDQANFAPSPNLPSCVLSSVQDGDPHTGRSIIMLRFKQGCVIPWHWLTPNARVIVVTGTLKSEMKDGISATLKQGDFLLLPSKHVYNMTAMTAVELYNILDAALDIHYVDAEGKEIPVVDALKAANESTSATPASVRSRPAAKKK